MGFNVINSVDKPLVNAMTQMGTEQLYQIEFVFGICIARSTSRISSCLVT